MENRYIKKIVCYHISYIFLMWLISALIIFSKVFENAILNKGNLISIREIWLIPPIVGWLLLNPLKLCLQNQIPRKYFFNATIVTMIIGAVMEIAVMHLAIGIVNLMTKRNNAFLLSYAYKNVDWQSITNISNVIFILIIFIELVLVYFIRLHSIPFCKKSGLYKIWSIIVLFLLTELLVISMNLIPSIFINRGETQGYIILIIYLMFLSGIGMFFSYRKLKNIDY